MECNSLAALFAVSLIVLLTFTEQSSAIRCYECNSNANRECSETFDGSKLYPADCNIRDPGSRATMCKKSKQKDTGLIVRRCATRSEQNNQPGCTWGNDDMGRYGEICYCATEMCNGASTLQFVTIFALFPLVLIKYYGLI